MLKVDGLSAFYGRAQVLFDVGFEVAEGQVVALLGRNGAGKSTTLKCIMGLIPRAAGSVTFDGTEVSGRAPYRVCRLGLGYVPEERRIFSGLSVAENLEAGRRPSRPGAPAWTPERLFSLFPNLAELRQRPGGRISGGEQQMLSIARTLMGNPSAVLLDEPSAGLAPRIVDDMARLIGELKGEGLTVLLSEQNLRFAARVADHACVLETGCVRWQGTMPDFLADSAAQRHYLMA